MQKRNLFLSLFVLFVLPLAAQESVSDSAYTFRFVRGKEMFFVPYRDNVPTLDRLIRRLEACHARLDSGYIYVSVTGYVSPGKDKAATHRMGYLRNSYVKSELILRAGLTEGMFVTDKVIFGATAGGLTDVVVVTFPAPVEKVERIAGSEAAARVEAYIREVSGEAERERLATERVQREKAQSEQARLAAEREAARMAAEDRRATEQAERERLAAQEAAARQAERDRLAAEEAAKSAGYTFALRANLLRWATLTPDLGVEWRTCRDWGVQLNGSWTSWSWDGRNRRYALWNISPAVHYYIGTRKRAYVGAMFQTGEFHYKLGDIGKQGHYCGGGVTGGYLLQLGRSLALDFSLGAGYTRAGYDKYTVIDHIRVKRGKEDRNYWGVNHAGITLIWQLK